MPSVAQRQKRRAQRGEPRLLTTGSWSTLADGAPDFGPANPPPDAVAAGMTERVVKDVVRVGRYFLGYDAAGRERYWNVTPQVLAQIVTNFRAMQANGQTPNLGKTHGDLKTLLIHPDDLVAPIADLRVSGDTLWMCAYVTPEDKAYLQNPARKVSIGSLENYSDSEDRRYPGDSLLHVAVTDRPAVNGQGPFIAMADSAGGSSMNPELLDAINVLMEAAGLSKLGEVADETDLISQLKGVAAAIGKTVEPASEPDGGEPMAPPADSLDMTGVPAAMQNTLRKFLANVTSRIDERDEQIKTLTNELNARKQAEKDAAKAAFDAECERVQREPVNGYVASAAVVTEVKALAASLGTHDVRLLKTIRRDVKLGGGVAKSLADAEPPRPVALSNTIRDPDTRKATAARIAELRGISVEEASKYLAKTGG